MMNIEDIRIKADTARQLQRDDAFRSFIEEVRKDQLDTFANSAAQDIDRREEAHAILRALGKIESAIQSAIDEEAFYDHKHKGTAPL